MARERIRPETAERVRNLARMVDAETLAEFIICNYFYHGGAVEQAVQRLSWEREYEQLDKRVETLIDDNKKRHERDKGHLLTNADVIRALKIDARNHKNIDACWKRMDELRALMYPNTTGKTA